MCKVSFYKIEKINAVNLQMRKVASNTTKDFKSFFTLNNARKEQRRAPARVEQSQAYSSYAPLPEPKSVSSNVMESEDMMDEDEQPVRKREAKRRPLLKDNQEEDRSLRAMMDIDDGLVHPRVFIIL
jgi:hypothetical protein